MKISKLLSSVLATGAFVVSAGWAMAATTITITDTSITVECSSTNTDPDCWGYVNGGSPAFPTSQGTLSTTSADLYDLPNHNPTTEAQALDILIDGLDDDDYTTGFQTDTGGVDTYEFKTDADYLAIVIGGGTLAGDTIFLKLSDPDIVTINYDKNGQSSGGISHITSFGGGITEIPLPATGLLLIGGLGGLAALRRRKKA